MGWFSGWGNDVEAQGAAYQSVNHDNIPVAHAVVIAPSDSQDFARPPPTNPSLQRDPELPSQTTASSRQERYKGTGVINSETYTVPAVATQSPQQQHLQSTTAERLPEFTRNPQVMSQCPECQAVNARTRIRTYPTCLTLCACIVLLFLFWPLCWLPLVLDSMKQTDHYCLVCDRRVGSLRPFQNFCVKTRA